MQTKQTCAPVPYKKHKTGLVDFKLTDKNNIFDSELVPDTIYDLRKIILDKKIRNIFPGFSAESFRSTYLSQNRLNNAIDFLSLPIITDKISPKQLDDVKTLQNKIKKIIFKNNFETYISLAFYLRIRNMPIEDLENCIVFSYDTSLLKTLLDYVHYDLNSQINVQYFYPHNENGKETMSQKNNVKFNKLEILTIPYINDLVKNTIDTKLIIIDAIVLVGERGDSYIYRLNYAFKMIFNLLLVAMYKLKQGGTIHIVMPPMGKKYIFNMVTEICNLFDSYELYDVPYVCHGEYVLLNNLYVMQGFHGATKDVLKLLIKLNELNGQDKMPDGVYINESTETMAEYKNWMATKIDKNILSILELENVIKNITIGEVIMKFKMAYLETFKIAEKLGLELADWAFNESYFKDIVTLLELTHVSGALFHKKYASINSKHSDMESKKKELLYLSENVYQYVEKIDSKKYTAAELYFNNLYKNLNRLLATEYDITIGGQYVSRAWMKMYEILTVTDFFDNISNDPVRGFHICEAPGNFIASIMYFLNKRGIKYDWRAQSLKDGPVFDQYGFIKDNPDRWDFADGSGDIMKLQNLIYYSEKYGGVDVVVGDCGEKWSAETVIFGAVQLIYVLLTLRVGGNFVIKTFAGNVNELFLSVLNLACKSFVDIYYYKSPINFWSHEIYVCGKGFKGISAGDRTNLVNMMKTRKNTLDSISDEVFNDYFTYAKQVIHTSAVYKKFFVFCADNPEYIEKYGNRIKQVVKIKNSKWLKYFVEEKQG
uniref:Ribosomal RNA methyltransferase FtsJ domain-containing protein n=1 Tax=viral metagenome TaxID=1070528 RepID=A0A6C0CB56_9ZZZZ